MKKFAIVYGQMENDIQKRALEELTSILLDYTLEYPICIPYGTNKDIAAYKRIYIGTKQSNPYIKENSSQALSVAEEYYIKVTDETVMIEGFDDAGVLYGVLDFYNKYITKFSCNFRAHHR